MVRFERIQWSEEAREGLKDTFVNGYDKIAEEAVRSNRFQLWKIDGHSYALTEAQPHALRVWCYQGRDLIKFTLALCQAAQMLGYDRIEFETQRKGMQRYLKKLFNPVYDDVTDTYTIYLKEKI